MVAASSLVERTNGKLSTPFTRKSGKAKTVGENHHHHHQQQQQRRRPPKPLWQRCLPLAVSSAVLHGLPFFFKRSSDDFVLFALLCFMGGGAAVEAVEGAITMFGCMQPAADMAVSHFKLNASGYMASFVMVIVLQGVWSQAQGSEEDSRDPYLSALPCLAVLSLGILAHLVAPSIGGFLLRQLDDVRLASPLPSGDRPCARWGWKTAKECFATSVVFGLCITAAVLSGGGALLLGLGMTHSVVSASREALPVIRKGWLKRKMSPSKSTIGASSSTQDYSLQDVITTICSWPKECTDRLLFLLRVVATTVCATHLLRPSLPEPDAPARGSNGDSSRGGSTTWANKVFVCLCSMAAWTLLLLCCLIVFGRQESSEGILAVVLIVTVVALRTRREKTWRGLVLLFWVALLANLVNVACSKLLQQNKVFQRVFSDDVGGPVVPSYLGVFRAMSQLREEGRVAMWTVCPPTAMEGAGRSWLGSWSL
eukprot:g6047.t1